MKNDFPENYNEEDLSTEFESDTFRAQPFQVIDQNGNGIDITTAEIFSYIREKDSDGIIKKELSAEVNGGITKTQPTTGWAQIDEFSLRNWKPINHVYDIVVRLNGIELTRLGGNFKVRQRATRTTE